MLFLEFHGTERASPSNRQRFGEIAADLGGGPFEWTTKAEERTRLWQARHDAYWAACRPAARREGACDRRLRADFAAGRMRDRDPARHRRATSWSRRSSAMSATAISTCRCWSTSTTPTRSRAPRRSCERLVERALAMEGTCTGEHGVGQGKMKYLTAEHGAPALAVDARHQAARSTRTTS